mmetsp:Transcript_121601/g.171131  ORF Transcript_121601/g.171131 Transcript_121601/m.171131 type:complete len:192 (-) Transcript_121601:25-600(-)
MARCRLAMLLLGAQAMQEERPPELLRKAWVPESGPAQDGLLETGSLEISHTGDIVWSHGHKHQLHTHRQTAIGPAGAKGDAGDRGAAGAAGKDGPKGAKGDRGDQGDVGDPGPTGDAPETPKPLAGAAKIAAVGVAFFLHVAVLGVVFATIVGKMKKQAAEEKATEVFGGEEEEYAGEGEEYYEEEGQQVS